MNIYSTEYESEDSLDICPDNFSMTSTSKPLTKGRWPTLISPFETSNYISDRASPGHDLGYHTLITRHSLASTPNQSPYCSFRALPNIPHLSSNWNDLSSPCPSSLSQIKDGSLSMRRPSLQMVDTEKMLTNFKGKKHIKSSPFEKLSDDVLLKIFSFLSSNYLCVCARVCRRWYFLAWEQKLWTSVNLNSDKIFVDVGLKTLFRLLSRDSPTVCHTVERIILNGCSRLTDNGLNTIARKCPELRTLEIRGCSNVTNEGISEIVSRCANLEKLDLTGCFLVTCVQPLQPTSLTRSSDLPPAARHLCLQYLDLTDCKGVDDLEIKIIVRNSPQLTHLYLRRCVQVTDTGIKFVASYCIMMREFSVSDCIQVTDFGMYELANLGPNLRYLSVAKCDQISDAGIKQIARHCYKLRYLNVRGCEAVSDNSLEVIALSCPRLRALDVGKCDITDYGLRLLSEHCPNLKKLSVKSCDMVTDNGVRSIAFYCRGLQQLNIQNCPVTVDSYRTVKKYCKRCIIEHTNPGFC